MSSKAFHNMGCMQSMWYVARSVGGSYIFLGNRYPLTGRNSISRPIPAKRVNTFKYLRSTLSEEEKLDAEVTHRVQNG